MPLPKRCSLHVVAGEDVEIPDVEEAVAMVAAVPVADVNNSLKSNIMIRLNCFVKVSAENKAEVLAAAKRLTEASLKQEGCKAYDIFESATREDVLMFCETWRDQVALDAHAASEEFKKEVSIIEKLAQLSIEKFDFNR